MVHTNITNTDYVGNMGILLASFPGPRAAFGCTKERRGPGMFPHVRDVEGRKVVERT